MRAEVGHPSSLVLGLVESAVDLGEVKRLAHDALVDVENVGAGGLEVGRRIVRGCYEKRRLHSLVNRSLYRGLLTKSRCKS